MDWISGIQKAIDYIEAHLDEELTYPEIAQKAYASGYHFQRIFSIVSGMTLGEYIRGRRLTKAAAALMESDARIIDIALKYGYQTPESFSRAFTRFHGIAPSAVRQRPVQLRSLSPLSVIMTLKGGNIMDYQIINRPAFTIIGKTQTFSTNDAAATAIPAFWQQAHRDQTVARLYQLSNDDMLKDTVLGVCFSEDAQGSFPYAIAAAVHNPVTEPGYQTITIPAATWAIFRCTGSMPNAIQQLWKDIYTMFFPASDYQPGNGPDLEVYPAGNMDASNYQAFIWIPITKK